MDKSCTRDSLPRLVEGIRRQSVQIQSWGYMAREELDKIHDEVH